MSCPNVDVEYEPSPMSYSTSSRKPVRASSTAQPSRNQTQETTHNYTVQSHIEGEQLVCVLLEDLSRIRHVKVIAKGNGSIQLKNDFIDTSVQVESGVYQPFQLDIDIPYLESSQHIINVNGIAEEGSSLDVALVQVNY